MADEPFHIPARHGHATTGDEGQAALRRRFDAASTLLSVLPIDLPWMFLTQFAPMLQPPLLRDLPAPPCEIPFLNQLLAGLIGAEPAEFARYMAAAMLYFLPHELPLTPSPSQLPLWIRVPYLHWALSRPQSFHGAGEAALYDRWREDFRQVIAREFAKGGGLEDLPEYQWPRFRRLVEQELELSPRA